MLPVEFKYATFPHSLRNSISLIKIAKFLIKRDIKIGHQNFSKKYLHVKMSENKEMDFSSIDLSFPMWPGGQICQRVIQNINQ